MTEQSEPEDLYISVDIETTGPVPEFFSMHQIGACVVGRTDIRFKADLWPIRHTAIELEALDATGYSLGNLVTKGKEPQDAMNEFSLWVGSTVPKALGMVTSGYRPIFLAMNTAFDWMFYRHYQVKYRVSNAFGYDPRDLKSLIADVLGCSWREAKKSRLPPGLRATFVGRAHDALDDAIEQAEIFEKLQAVIQARRFHI